MKRIALTFIALLAVLTYFAFGGSKSSNSETETNIAPASCSVECGSAVVEVEIE